MFQFKVRLNFSPRKMKQKAGPNIQLSNLTTQLLIPLTKRMIL